MKTLLAVAALALTFGSSLFAQSPAPEPKLPSKDDRRAWWQILPWPKSCESGWTVIEGRDSGIDYWIVEPGLYVVEVACGSGAYNAEYRYYLYRPAAVNGAVIPLDFEGAPREAGSPSESQRRLSLLGQSRFDVSAKRLTIVSLGRGIGDCRDITVYQYCGGRFHLVEYRDKPDCDGGWVEDDEVPLKGRWPLPEGCDQESESPGGSPSPTPTGSPTPGP